jgi:polyisoprenyl-phosphate glycosyltransferase
MFKITIVIPCYNEAENISNTFDILSKEIKYHTDEYEIIFVDNGGDDGQLDIMVSVYEQAQNHVKIISLSRNFGYQMSMSAGLEYASGDAVIFFDADLQDPPFMIKNFIDKWKEGYDVVYGIRENRKAPYLLKFLYRIFYRVFKITSDINVPLDASEFGLMSKEVVNKIKQLPERVRFIRGLRAWVGFNQIGIKYNREERKKGKTKFKFFDSMVMAMDGILSFSTRILTLTTLLGVLTTIVSILLLIYILIWKLTSGEAIPGYTATIVTISFFSGIIIFMLGISGAFIERIFLEVKSRPKFIVKETWGF